MRTIDDWLREAATAPQTTDALDRAEAQVQQAWHARQVLAWLIENRADDTARLERVAAVCARLGLEEGGPWPIREAAEVYARHLDDEPAAMALYEAAASRYERDERAPLWGLLVEGAHALWGDGGPAPALLQRALAATPDAVERARLAATAHVIGDEDLAVRILDALDTSELDGHGAWSVANAWHALARDDRAAAVLDIALQRDSLSDRCRVVRAFGSHGNADGAARALEGADALADSAADWLAVADTAHDAGLGEGVVRERLRRGVEAAATPDERAQLAAAYVSLLVDISAADALAPRGLRPAEQRQLHRDLDGWPGDAAGLFDHLREAVPDAVLQHIAAADYGMDRDKHLAALRDLTRSGVVPAQLPWEPLEVLRLTRWAEGDTVDHLERAFACAVLLLGDPEGDLNGFAPLVDSALSLGGPVPALTEAYAAWHYRTADEYDSEAQGSALWALALLTAARDPSDSRLGGVADALRVLDAERDHERPGGLADDLLEYAVRAAMWRELTERCLVPHRALPAVARVLEVLGGPGPPLTEDT